MKTLTANDAGPLAGGVHYANRQTIHDRTFDVNGAPTINHAYELHAELEVPVTEQPAFFRGLQNAADPASWQEMVWALAKANRQRQRPHELVDALAAHLSEHSSAGSGALGLWNIGAKIVAKRTHDEPAAPPQVWAEVRLRLPLTEVEVGGTRLSAQKAEELAGLLTNSSLKAVNEAINVLRLHAEKNTADLPVAEDYI